MIDNDSGTYRPKAEYLPLLKEFLNENFPGLHVVTKECTDNELDKMKEEQRARKKKEGKNVDMVQNSDDDISSSDEERLNNTGKKTKRQKAFDALEDPAKAVKEMMPGGKGDVEREERETAEDTVEIDGGRRGV